VRDSVKVAPRFIAATLPHIAMAVLLLAAVAKFVDLSAFRDDLRSWQLLPQSLQTAATFLVPLSEALIAGRWYLRRSRPLTVMAGIVLLVVVTGTYAAHVALVGPPACGCFGMTQEFLQAKSQWQWVIARNLILIGCLSAYWAARASGGARGLPRSDASGGGPAIARRQGPGFTLVELLISIAIVGVLIAMLLPHLGGFKAQVHATGSLANLRTHGAVTQTYTGDYQDVFFHTDPTATYTVLRCGDIVQTALYFEAFNKWNIALAPGYYNGDSGSRVFARPDQRHRVLVSEYWYSSSLLASAPFWNPLTRTGPDQWQGTRLTDVAFPSKKSVHFAVKTLSGPVETGFADGSASLVRPIDLMGYYFKGEGDWPGTYFGSGLPFLHTIDGVRGRDIR